MPEIMPVDMSEPVSEAQMEAQARVSLSRVVRNAQCVTCKHPLGVNIGEVKREMTVQIRRARKLAFEDAARHVMVALDFDTIIVPDSLPSEFRDVLRRVNALAKMCRGPE